MDRAFSYQAPAIWNQFPVSVRHFTAVSFCENVPRNPTGVNGEPRDTGDSACVAFVFLQHIQDAERDVLSKFRDKANKFKKNILMY